MKELKAYPDVEKGLKLLKQNGFRLATLSNSAEGILKQQLAFSNLSSYFELTLSVDTIKKYKPDLQTYTWAAEQLKVDPAAIIMVAAHGWDIAGAFQAGLQTAFIERKGQSLYPLSPKPNFLGQDLLETATAIIGE
jgi:2-haloacid dehalogenase